MSTFLKTLPHRGSGNSGTKNQMATEPDSASTAIGRMLTRLLGRWVFWIVNMGLRLGSLWLASLTPGYHLPPLRGSRAVNRCETCSGK